MKFQDKLAAAKAAPRPTATVTVALDTVVSRKRDELLEQLEKARQPNPDARLSKGTGEKKLQADLDALETEFADSLVELKFERMPGMEWAELTMTNPPRPDVLVDKLVGNYNVHAVTRGAAVAYGRVVENGEDVTLTELEWNDLFDAISGVETTDIVNTIYSLNAGEPEQAVQIAKKALAAIGSSEPTSEPPSPQE